MNTIDIARKLAACGQTEDACRAWTLALQQGQITPEEQMEAALYLLQFGSDHRIPYTCLHRLYTAGQFQQDCLSIMTEAFYTPNRADLKARYRRNCLRLKEYPYLFRKDFPTFEDLTIQFFPFDNRGYLPFWRETASFGPYVNFREPRITRNFFYDLENPILAQDVYSQYELEYLNDNVRPSEWVARENHIYLHYTDWPTFCAYLQCLDFTSLLLDRKIVFLIEEEANLYPIDFHAKFGIDYSKNKVKPISIREITRLIWHTQLSSHNGGDFFNEVMYGHPNLLCRESIMLSEVTQRISEMRKACSQNMTAPWKRKNPKVALELTTMKNPTDKDYLVAMFLVDNSASKVVDGKARIVPAVFFQPHFHNINYKFGINERGSAAVLYSEAYEQIRTSTMFQAFKYIKTFTPLRRPTTSYGASNKYQWNDYQENPDHRMSNLISRVVLNRSFLIDPQDRLYKDSILVRFEDGKLNPKATFTRLAAFLDLPYTESMTYCAGVDINSGMIQIDPEAMPGNVRGFDTASVYRTYDDFINEAEGKYIEYCLRDVYVEYGYDFHYYDGSPMTEERLEDLTEEFTTLDGYLYRNTYSLCEKEVIKGVFNGVHHKSKEEVLDAFVKGYLKELQENRIEVAQKLMGSLQFINKNGQPLCFMKKLEPDPNLLEQPLYH